MIRKTKYLSAIVLISGPFALTASAQTATNPIPENILACADEADVMRRLSCYDREVAATRMVIAPTPEPVVETPPQTVPEASPLPDAPEPVAPVAAVPIAAATVAAEIIEATPAPQPGSAQSAPDVSAEIDDFGYERPLEDITANVTEIRERPYGELVIRLDNGQVWEQKHVDRRFKLRVGETVTIKKGQVAGYRLSGSGNRSIQVQRVR